MLHGDFERLLDDSLVHDPVGRPSPVPALDQLQVVDHDQVHSLVEVQPPGLAADLHHPLVGGVVDVYGEFRELPYGVDDEVLLGGAVEAEADPV